jgi:acyl-CoA thioesterase
MGEFDEATAVSRRGDGRYGASVVPGWDIAGNANGGYLLAIAGRAMVDAVGRPPLSITAHYLSPGKVGPLDIAVGVRRVGRRVATASASVRSGSDDVIVVVGTFGDLVESGPTVVDAVPPDLPPLDECAHVAPPAPGSGFGDRVESRIHPDDAQFRVGRPSGRARVRGWFRFADGQPIDAVGLLLVADAFAPVIFNRPEFPVSWAPTLELTVHLRGVPVPGPLRCNFSSRFIQFGMFEEDGEIWDSDGTLVAQSRQLALTPRG